MMSDRRYQRRAAPRASWPGMATGVQETGMHQLMIHELLLFRFNSFQLFISHTSVVPRQLGLATNAMHRDRINTENREIRELQKKTKMPRPLGPLHHLCSWLRQSTREMPKVKLLGLEWRRNVEGRNQRLQQRTDQISDSVAIGCCVTFEPVNKMILRRYQDLYSIKVPIWSGVVKLITELVASFFYDNCI